MSEEPKQVYIRRKPERKKEKSGKKEKCQEPKELATNSFISRDVKEANKELVKAYKDAGKQAKQIMKQLDSVQVLDDQQIKSLLTLTALGLVKDRFGMEISADTRLKAISELSKINEAEKNREAKMSFENQSYEDLPSYLDLLKITPEEEAEANANASNTDSKV